MSDLISRQNAIKGVKELFACADIGKDECDITYMLKNLPSADRPKNMIHIDEVYRLIAGHSNYHGDSILSAFTCLVEGKDVKPIAPLDESADRPTEEEDQLKFYYVESIDDYWIGMRIDNFYYANWHEGLGFIWSHSRYLPWGEHVVDERTLWKEHTYPSEPVEISFTDWIVGFVKKYFADRPTEMMEDGTLAVRVSGAKDVSRVLVMDTDSHVGGGLYYVDKDNKPTGKWVFDEDGYFRCEVCGKKPNDQSATTDYCPKCGARLGGDTE